LEFLLVRSQVGLENITESGSKPVVVLEAWFEAPMKHAEDEEKQVDCGLWSGQPRHAFTSPQDSAATLIGHCRPSLLLIRSLNSKAFAPLSVR
jgi:hypothetical protein